MRLTTYFLFDNFSLLILLFSWVWTELEEPNKKHFTGIHGRVVKPKTIIYICWVYHHDNLYGCNKDHHNYDPLSSQKPLINKTLFHAFSNLFPFICLYLFIPPTKWRGGLVFNPSPVKLFSYTDVQKIFYSFERVNRTKIIKI